MLNAQVDMVLGITSARINSYQTFLHINKTLKIAKNLILHQPFDRESTMVIKRQGWMLISRFPALGTGTYLEYGNKDCGMSFGLAKENKFEIIATLREELHKKTKLEVLCENSNVITQLEKIDFERFTISWHEDIVPEKIQYFILHSDSGIIKFSARFATDLPSDAEAGLSYFIPDMIFFAQQRQNQRFSFLKGYDFFCFGRYKNGENYSLKIKNISQGGCALIVKDVNARFLYKDAVIKGASLDFEAFGSLQLDLKVIDVVTINEFDEDNQLYTCHQISCGFDFKHRREEAEVEKIIIKFLMSNKIRSL